MFTGIEVVSFLFLKVVCDIFILFVHCLPVRTCSCVFMTFVFKPYIKRRFLYESC